MIHSLTACSISLPLHASLVAPDPPPATSGRVLGAFDRACGVALESGGVVAVVSEDIGNGPFNVVVCADGQTLAGIRVDDRVRLEDGLLTIGNVAVDLRPARPWNPCPDWPFLRGRLDAIRSSLGSVRQALDTQRSPLLALALGGEASGPLATRLAETAAGIRAGWEGDQEALARAVGRLAGLGPGLTPAGDDFLLGLLVWAWLSHPDPPGFGRTVSSAAAPRTTTLAAAWLRAAAAGELAAPWHRLLQSLAGPESASTVQQALPSVLAHGATSGADALAGFLWLANG
jgi:hypothetical protein